MAKKTYSEIDIPMPKPVGTVTTITPSEGGWPVSGGETNSSKKQTKKKA